mmetsp:Transcript_16394/g.41708  ORF Transcript_16394/g.41708 Transcript_16394/m.41708 type:complete len:444 (-) Transcript_16394:608-1939(-)
MASAAAVPPNGGGTTTGTAGAGGGTIAGPPMPGGRGGAPGGGRGCPGTKGKLPARGAGKAACGVPKLAAPPGLTAVWDCARTSAACDDGGNTGGGGGATSKAPVPPLSLSLALIRCVSTSKWRLKRSRTPVKVSLASVCCGQKKPGLLSPSHSSSASASDVGPSRAIQPSSVPAAADASASPDGGSLVGNKLCNLARKRSPTAPVTSAAVRVATSVLYFLRREESHISMTGPWPSTVNNFLCNSPPKYSKSGSAAHIQRKRVRKPCKARATATRKASFLVGCLTAVKNRTRGCSIFDNVSASAIGVAGNRGADSSQAFKSLVQPTTNSSTLAGTAGRSSMTRFCTSSLSSVRRSPRPSANRPRNDSSMRGTKRWKGADRHSSTTSDSCAEGPVPAGPDGRLSLSSRKLTHAAIFSCVLGESLPCWSSAQRHISGNCCVLASNL